MMKKYSKIKIIAKINLGKWNCLEPEKFFHPGKNVRKFCKNTNDLEKVRNSINKKNKNFTCSFIEHFS